MLRCAAGELGALEEVVKEFLQNQHLSATILHELWGIAEKAFDAVTRNATQAERQVLLGEREERPAFNTLCLAETRHRPQACKGSIPVKSLVSHLD